MKENRLNVALSSDAGEALDQVQSRTGLTKSELVNRAVVMYAFMDGEVRDGGKLLVQHEEKPDTVIRFF